MGIPLLAVVTSKSTTYIANFDTPTGFMLLDPIGFPAPEAREAVAQGQRRGNPMTAVMRADVATRSIVLSTEAADAHAAEDYATALRNALNEPDARLVWQRTPTSRAIGCDILSAELSEDGLDLLLREQGQIPLRLVMDTDAVWYAIDSKTATASVSAPGTGVISSVGGDAPARCVHRMTVSSAANCIGLGILPNAGANYDPVDAASGPYALPAALPADGTLVYTPASIDMYDNAGTHETMLRFHASVPAPVLLRPVSAITGSGAFSTTGVSAKGDVALDTVGTADAWHRMGQVRIPCAPLPLPAGFGGTAYGPEYQDVTQDASDASATTLQTQTFTVVKTGVLSAISIVTDAATSVDVALYRAGNLIGSGTLANVTSSGAIRKVPVYHQVTGGGGMPGSRFGPVLVTAGETLTVTGVAAGANVYYKSTSVYAGGARTGGGDLRFRVHVKPLIAIGATVGVQAAKTTAAADIGLTHLVRLPADFGCFAVAETYLANDGLVADATGLNGCSFFKTNTSGDVGPLSPTWVMDRGVARLRPGDNTLVLIGEGTISYAVEYWEGFSGATAGEL